MNKILLELNKYNKYKNFIFKEKNLIGITSDIKILFLISHTYPYC